MALAFEVGEKVPRVSSNIHENIEVTFLITLEPFATVGGGGGGGGGRHPGYDKYSSPLPSPPPPHPPRLFPDFSFLIQKLLYTFKVSEIVRRLS